MDKCNCYHSTTAYQQKIQPWAEKISATQMENIKKNFASKKPMNDEPFMLKKEASSDTAPVEPVKREPIVITKIKVVPYYTGYARIDNAITDALCGKSLELKDNVYDIMWNDLLPTNVHGLSETDRKALISLGVQKAEYLADQFMNDKEKDSFMEAIRSVARIGMEGKRIGTCDMEYDVKHVIGLDGNNHVRENDMELHLFAMEKKDPEAYKKYQSLRNSSKNGVLDAALFAVRWAMKNQNVITAFKPEYDKAKDEKYEKLQKVKLDDTFSKADTSSKERFLASIAEILKKNPTLQSSFFLNRISQMAQTSGDYLIGRQMILSGKV